jgi:hypothetical protein
MFNTKTVLAAASLAVAAGIGAAAAAPWDRTQAGPVHADRQRIAEALRLHHYRVMDNPYFVHGRYVVRAHDQLGHLVFVQVDPVSGAFVREVIL